MCYFSPCSARFIFLDSVTKIKDVVYDKWSLNISLSVESKLINLGNFLCPLYVFIRGRIQKFPDWVDNEINNNNKYSLRSNTKGYGGKTP
jgi:hypothetical protein